MDADGEPKRPWSEQRSGLGDGAVARQDHSPAGWHLDLLGRYEWRYWDGTAWTERVRTGAADALFPPTATTGGKDPLPVPEGLPDPGEEYEKWAAAGFEDHERSMYYSLKLSVEEALADKARTDAHMREYDMRRHGWNATWESAFSPEDAAAWKAAGFDLREAVAWDEALPLPDDDYEQEVFEPPEIRVATAKEWQAAGLSAAEADDWRLKFGDLTEGVAKDLSYEFHLHIAAWKGNGYDGDQAYPLYEMPGKSWELDRVFPAPVRADLQARRRDWHRTWYRLLAHDDSVHLSNVQAFEHVEFLSDYPSPLQDAILSVMTLGDQPGRKMTRGRRRAEASELIQFPSTGYAIGRLVLGTARRREALPMNDHAGWLSHAAWTFDPNDLMLALGSQTHTVCTHYLGELRSTGRLGRGTDWLVIELIGRGVAIALAEEYLFGSSPALT